MLKLLIRNSNDGDERIPFFFNLENEKLFKNICWP